MFHYRYIWMLLSLCLFTGCSSRSLREARNVVHEADSLWQQGQMYDDSTQLAQAYNTLHAWRAFYTDEYAHACYHYGKLLREKEDPVTAMQVFINATRSHTHDFHMLGRVYSNMGDICHLAGAFPLAYEMYRQSGEWYLRNGDTLLYYYDLNNMALELASQGKKDSCISLLRLTVDTEYNDSLLTAFGLYIQAEAYLRNGQYDSTIVSAHSSQQYDPSLLHTTMQLAQAYSFMGVSDSATCYASVILQKSQNLSDLHNALYIITNDDSSKNIEGVRKVSAERSDIQKVLKIRQGKLSQAVQLLEQDLARKPSWAWLYAIIATLLIGGACIWIYVHRKRNQHQLLSQQVEDLTKASSIVQAKHDEMTKQYLTNHAHIIEDIEQSCELINSSKDMRAELCWNNYEQMCTIVNRRLYGIIHRMQPFSLSEKEMRLCILVLLKANTGQMTDMIPYARSGLGKFKNTTARKIGTTTREMRSFILNLLA